MMMQRSGGLTEEQQTHFREAGFLMVPDVFTREELEPLRRELADIVDTAARRLAAEGKITELRAEEPLETRLTRLMADHPELVGEYERAIWGKGGGGHTGREMYNILTHPRLLDAIESLVGPEIVASSVYRVRPKVPGWKRGEVPWHQDSGYFSFHCDSNLIVTCWMPLVDATLENGCLKVLPRVHRRGIATHHTGGPGGYLVIEETDLPPEEEGVFVPVPLGGVLLLTNMTPHCSESNTSDVVRWSVDLRYQSREVPTNAFQEPEAFDPDAPLTEIACYPPEADFVVRSLQHPETISTYEQYVSRRNRYDAAMLSYPKGRWQPVSTAS